MVTEQQAAELVGAIFRATRMPIADAEERRQRRKELGEELMRLARSLEHAEEIARRCRESFDEFPTIRQLQQVAAAVTMGDEPPPTNLGRAGCAVCGGDGWEKTAIIARGIRFPAVRPCACRSAG